MLNRLSKLPSSIRSLRENKKTAQSPSVLGRAGVGPLVLIFFILPSFNISAQTTASESKVPPIDSVKIYLQGAWRMNADTNVVLVFAGDSMFHRMMRTSGLGRVRFAITNKNCDTTRFEREKAIYLEETYRYYQYKTAYDGKLCNKIVYLKGNTLILKRDGILESYTKLKFVPPKR